MSDDFLDILDEAATRLRDGEPLDSVLVAYPGFAAVLAPLLESAAYLAQLQAVSRPKRVEDAADRRIFLEQAAHCRQQKEPAILPVSPSLLARLNAWRQERLRWPATRRLQENRPMFALLVKIIVIAALGLGAAGGTVAAAAGSLPDSALYPVKIGVEDVRLSLAGGPAEEAELAMAFVQERVREMQEIALKGDAPDEALMTRFHLQLQTTLQQAAQVDDDEELNGLLQRLQQRLRAEENELATAQARLQIHEQVRERLQIAEQALKQAGDGVAAGIGEPALYRYRYAYGRPADLPPQPDVVPPAEEPVQNQMQQRQGVPAGEANGPQGGQETAPVRSQEQKGDLDRKQDHGGQPEGAPAGPAGPANNQNGQGEPADEPAQQQYQNQNQNQDQNQNQQQGPSSLAPGPVLTMEQERTQEEAGPLADPPCENGAQTLTETQAGPPEEYPEPSQTQEQSVDPPAQPPTETHPGSGNG
jgi:hypothetical protein